MVSWKSGRTKNGKDDDMPETKEKYEELRKQFIKEYGIDEATEKFFRTIYKKRLQYRLIIAILVLLELIQLLLKLLSK